MPTAAPDPVRTPEAGIKLLREPLTATAWIAGVFSVLVCATMLYYYSTAAANDPWKAPQLLALKDRLSAEPKNEQLKEQIRKFDLEFRQDFRRHLVMDRLGGWLLVGGALVLVVSARKAAVFNRSLPQPEPDRAGRLARIQSRARWSVGLAAGVAALALLAVSFAIGTALPATEAGWRKLAGSAEVEPAVVPLPTTAELQANSPRFRGWDGNGTTTQTNFALSWDNKTGNGIAWKSPIPAQGHSSPIVWGNQVFISGGTAAKREVFCYEVSTGKMLWSRTIENVPRSPPQTPAVPEDTGVAASTAATDGRQLYVMFANGDLAALKFDGSVAWSKAFGPLKNLYGHATSLATWHGVVIAQLDQGEGRAADSKLLAMEGGTGRLLWTQTRPVPVSWATPIIIEAAGKTQIITLGLPWVIANSFADGSELWRAALLENEIVPSPVFAGGLIFAVSPSSKLVALRPDGAGDVTKTHVVWAAEDNVPDITSPVSNGELVFTVSSSGMVTCFDAKNGAKLWEHDLSLEVKASLAIVGSQLFVLGEKGAAVVLQAGREFRENFRSELPDKFLASPAFANGRVFLRGATNLFCLAPSQVAADVSRRKLPGANEAPPPMVAAQNKLAQTPTPEISGLGAAAVQQGKDR